MSEGIGLNVVTENCTTFFTTRKEVCHLEFALGASLPQSANFSKFRGSQKGWRMFPRNENRNEGTFRCSPGTKTQNEGITGPNFFTPTPPTPENTLLGLGSVCKRGGGACKIPAAWGLKIYTPTPPPLENAFWAEMGGTVCSPKPPFYNTALLFPLNKSRELAILKTTPFDTPLSAAKETPNRALK